MVLSAALSARNTFVVVMIETCKIKKTKTKQNNYDGMFKVQQIPLPWGRSCRCNHDDNLPHFGLVCLSSSHDLQYNAII